MVTAKDVAKLAGVSQATVSYVMSGRRPISEATKQRVRKAMRELNYVPNANARSLAGGKTGVIGVVVRMDEDTDMAELRPFLVVIMREARAQGYNVMLVPADEGVDGLERMVRQNMVDGIIVFDIEWHDNRLERIAKMGIPTVLFGSPEDSHGLACVDVDYRRIAQLAVNNLAEQGAERIVVVGDYGRDATRYSFSKFFAGEAHAVAAVLGITCTVFVPPQDGWRGIWALKDEVIGLSRVHGGVAVRTPRALNYLLQLCAELGVVPGRDLYIVAVHTDEYACSLRRPVPNVDPVPEEMARKGMDGIFAQLRGERVADQLVPPHVTMR